MTIKKSEKEKKKKRKKVCLSYGMGGPVNVFHTIVSPRGKSPLKRKEYIAGKY